MKLLTRIGRPVGARTPAGPMLLVVVLTAGAVGYANAQSGDSPAVEIQVGDNMRFVPSVIEAHPGQRMRVRLLGTGRIANLVHNFVLLKKGITPKSFVDRAAPATKETGALDPAMSPSVVAASPLVPSGGRVEVTFDAPSEPGEYAFVCTFPGHFNLGMRGRLLVR